MTTLTKRNFPINNSLTADITFHIGPDLTAGLWNEEVIVEDFEIHQLYEDGKPVEYTSCLTAQLISCISREFYSPNAKTGILQEAMDLFYEENEIIPNGNELTEYLTF